MRYPRHSYDPGCTTQRYREDPSAYLSARLATHASDASSHEARQAPVGSSLPSQQSHTPSPTLDDGSRTDRCPRLAHSKTPVVFTRDVGVGEVWFLGVRLGRGCESLLKSSRWKDSTMEVR